MADLTLLLEYKRREFLKVLASGASLTPFWLGKIAVGHAKAIEELLQRGLVRPPLFTPLFLEVHRALMP